MYIHISIIIHLDNLIHFLRERLFLQWNKNNFLDSQHNIQRWKKDKRKKDNQNKQKRMT